MIEVLKQMQKALREYHYYTIDAGLPNQSMLNKGYAAYQAGLKAIAELESQEPVALPCCGYTDASAVKWNPLNNVVQCHNCGQNYTATPQRTWVGLTIEEIASCCRESTTTQLSFYNAIEAKLKQKNGFAEEKNT
jgi:hypothetical protein